MKVLIVDDNAGTRAMLKILLEKAGHQVLGEAEDGRGALKAFLELRPEVVLLDIIMPGISGIVVLEEIRRVSPATKVIMLTAVDDLTIAMESVRLGASDYLTKPFDTEDLFSAIRRVSAT